MQTRRLHFFYFLQGSTQEMLKKLALVKGQVQGTKFHFNLKLEY